MIAKNEYKVLFKNGHEINIKANGMETKTITNKNGVMTMEYLEFKDAVTFNDEYPIYICLDEVMIITVVGETK